MAPARTYGDGCGIAHAMDLVGERWGLLVVRELLLGPKRFTDLRSGLPNTSPNVLAQRLREFEEASIVQRRRLPAPAASWVYELTDWGRELGPVVIALGLWGARSPVLPMEGTFSPDSVALALESLFDREAADGFNARLELRLGDDLFAVTIADGEIDVTRGSASDPDAVIDTDVDTLRCVLWQDGELAKMLEAGDMRVEGDRRAVRRFARLFPRPEPAPATVA